LFSFVFENSHIPHNKRTNAFDKIIKIISQAPLEERERERDFIIKEDEGFDIAQ
jgi:hypothetical protein